MLKSGQAPVEGPLLVTEVANSRFHDLHVLLQVDDVGVDLTKFLSNARDVLDVLQDCLQLVVQDFAKDLSPFVIARGLHTSIVGNYSFPANGIHVYLLCVPPCVSPHSRIGSDLRI